MNTREKVCSPVRRGILLCFMGLVALGLLWRAVDLQLVNQTFLQRQGDARFLRVVSSAAHRGRILDRHGEPLAVSTPVESIWVCPRTFVTERDRWGLLEPLLGFDQAALERLILDRMGREFLYVKRHVAPGVAERIAALSLNGVYRQREYRRCSRKLTQRRSLERGVPWVCLGAWVDLKTRRDQRHRVAGGRE